MTDRVVDAITRMKRSAAADDDLGNQAPPPPQQPAAVVAAPSQSLLEVIQTYAKDISFVRGAVYTTLPISMISLILLAAYRYDIKTSRNNTHPIFKYPMILALLFSFAAPFIIQSYDDKLKKIITP